MHAQKIVLASLLVALSACQKEAPPPAPAEPAMPAAEAPAAMDHSKMDHSTMMMGAAPEASAPAAPAPAAPAAAPAPAPAPAAAPAPAPAPKAPAAAAPAPAPAATMTGPTGGDDPMQLAKKDGCLACHSIDKKLIGPAWKDVAAKYRGDPKAEEKLFEKVTKGGSGVWGPVPMTPNAQYPEADRRALVKFIMTLK